MVSSSTTYSIVRSYIRFGKGEWERRDGVGGSWGPEFVLDRSMVECVCGLWFVNEQVGLVRMRRCVIEPALPCPYFFSPNPPLFFQPVLPASKTPPCLAFFLP